MGAWPESDLAVVRTMWAQGRSSHDIASSMSRPVSRHAVMGKIDRLGLMGLGHADDRRLAAIGRVSTLFGEPFFLGVPLHRETLLCILTAHGLQDVDSLALASGVRRSDCSFFLSRLPLFGTQGVPDLPDGIDGSEDGYRFVLDMAVLSGVLSDRPVRGGCERLAA